MRLLLRPLNAPLDFTNVVEILAEAQAVRPSDAALERGDVFGDEVEDAPVLLHAGAALVRGAAAAEHPLEQHAWIDLHRERRRRPLPAERVRVGAAEAGGARAEERGEVLGRDLERGERRVLADVLGDRLIER